MDRRTTTLALAASICTGLSLALGSAILHRARIDPLGLPVANGQPPVTDTPMVPQPPPQITPTQAYTLTVHPEWGHTGLTLAAHPEQYLQQLAHAPDGAGIAFTVNKAYEDGGADLYLAETDAAGTPNGIVRPLRAAPAGRAFVDLAASAAAGAYAVLSVDQEDPAINDLHLVSADGLTERNLTGGRFAVQDFQWAPDGARLALLTQGGALYQISAADGAASLLAEDLQSPAGNAAAVLAWSPDASRLAVAGFDGPTPRLEVITLADGSRLPLAVGDLDDLPLPAFAADGGLLYFLARPRTAGGGADSRLYRIAPLAGASPVNLAAVPGSGSAKGPHAPLLLGPDGSDLIFAMGGALWRLGTDGSGFQQLTVPGADVTGRPSLAVLPSGAALVAYVNYAPAAAGGSAGWTGPEAVLSIGTAVLP